MPHASQAANSDLYYEQGGHSDETVVFVNGLTMDATAWDELEDVVIETYATLRDYGCPLPVLLGADDLLTPPHYSEEIVAQSSHARRKILEDDGHAAPFERPEAVAAVLKTILEAGT